MAGETFSSDFPVTPGAYQTTNNAAANQGTNAFVTKLNPAGTALVYSTYLGGSGGDIGKGDCRGYRRQRVCGWPGGLHRLSGDARGLPDDESCCGERSSQRIRHQAESDWHGAGLLHLPGRERRRHKPHGHPRDAGRRPSERAGYRQLRQCLCGRVHRLRRFSRDPGRLPDDESRSTWVCGRLYRRLQRIHHRAELHGQRAGLLHLPGRKRHQPDATLSES